MDARVMQRGILAFEDEETPEWRRVVLTEGAGGMPKFATKSECEAFVRQHCWRGSNPSVPTLQHVFTTLVDWAQVQDVLITKMEAYDRRFPAETPPSIADTQNRFLDDAQPEAAAIRAAIATRLQLPCHKQTNREATIHTLKYLFFHARCGIFVMIRRRHVVLFVPFANRDFENAWGAQVQFDASEDASNDNGDATQHEYFREKQDYFRRREEFARDPRQWWNDGHAVFSEDLQARRKEPPQQYWDDHDLVQLRDLLEDACMHRNIPDCEFFINKQHYPHLKANLKEPFGFLYDRDDLDEQEDLPLAHHVYSSYAPILSFYTADRYADLPFPSSVDWEAATGLLFPRSFLHTHCEQCECDDPSNCENGWECLCDRDGSGQAPHGIQSPVDLFSAAKLRASSRPWEEKVETAFFRGDAGCSSASVSNNQRLQLAQLSSLWKSDPKYNGQRDGTDVSFLDAQLTAAPSCEIKAAKQPIRFMRTDKLGITVGPQHFVPLYDQAQFKYIVYVDGASASRRYSALMRLGSVILKVASSCVAKDLWFSPMLRPYEDHVPVRADLSDLAEQIQWCRDNDAKCRAIAAKAAELYESFLSKAAIHDYVELVCHEIADRFQPAAQWYRRPQSVDSIVKPTTYRPRSMCVSGSDPRHCRRCRELMQEDEQRRASRDAGDREDRSRYSPSSSFSSGRREYSSRGRDDYRSNDRHDGQSRRRGDMNDGSSPKRMRAQTVPQCRRCRRAKTACTCSGRR